MALTAIGRRIELVAMDSEFHEISLGLYLIERDARPAYQVHTYSSIEGVDGRIGQLVTAMGALGGLTVFDEGVVRFPCGERHELMARRVFLEASKLTSDEPAEPRPLHITDPKTGCVVHASSRGGGEYLIHADDRTEVCERKAAVIAKGLTRLTDAALVGDTSDLVQFPCGVEHDATVGLLLRRALNVRAAMREVEEAAARGVLSAPSSQSD